MDIFSSEIKITNRLSEAIDFAFEHHKNQQDKSGKPYFGHILRVMLSVSDYGEDYMIVALCHDLVEDCNVTIEEIKQKFGKVVADAVKSVSRIEFPIKEPYMNLIERASLNEIGREVKLADLGDNSRPERIASLSPESRDIVKRYDRAKKFLLASKEKQELEQARKQAEAIYENGGGS